jgi:hypothetical protein
VFMKRTLQQHTKFFFIACVFSFDCGYHPRKTKQAKG